MFSLCCRRSRKHSSDSSKTSSSCPPLGPSPTDIANAAKIKNEGNRLFRKGKFLAAAEKYTEAIVLHPGWTVALVNRANCYKQLEKWTEVERDCSTALKIDNQIMKAHYFLGLALEERQEHDSALRHLHKSYELARDQADQIMDEIWQNIARVSYSQWHLHSKQISSQDSKLKSKLLEILKEHHLLELQATLDKIKKSSEHQKELEALEEIFERACEETKEVPSCFTCPLTMDVFRDPVISPFGSSYERSALKAHLENAQKVDPVTQQPLEGSELIRNLNLRSATHLYLQTHPWAWKKSM